MDKISKERRRKNMQAIKSKDTKPEMLVRRLIHSMGHRYRLHNKDLPGKPDLVFASKKKVVYIHGCFWHQHNKKTCKIARIPKSNLDFWIPKLQRTVARDKEHLKALKKDNWDYLIIWECETKNLIHLEKKISNFINK